MRYQPGDPGLNHTHARSPFQCHDRVPLLQRCLHSYRMDHCRWHFRRQYHRRRLIGVFIGQIISSDAHCIAVFRSATIGLRVYPGDEKNGVFDVQGIRTCVQIFVASDSPATNTLHRIKEIPAAFPGPRLQCFRDRPPILAGSYQILWTIFWEIVIVTLQNCEGRESARNCRRKQSPDSVPELPIHNRGLVMFYLKSFQGFLK